MAETVKTVSVCTIAYNEESQLPSLLQDFLKQDYPHSLTEIILVDGASSDSTKQIMLQFQRENKDTFLGVHVLDNPKRIQAAGWNQALMAAHGDVIIRVDAHAHVPAEFVGKNMYNLQNGEFISGGPRPCLSQKASNWQRTLLQTENSLFGSSFGRAKNQGQPKYVKTMFHAAYNRCVLEKVGGFNENLLRTEDNELHFRIRKAGYRFYCDPGVVSYQYARSSLGTMLRQKYGNGYWIGLTVGVCPGCVSLYNFVPFLFVAAILITGILSFFHLWQFSALMWGMYGLFCLLNTILAASDFFCGYTFLMPLLFLALHISYGIGTFMGLVQMPFQRAKLSECDVVQEVKEKMIRNRMC